MRPLAVLRIIAVVEIKLSVRWPWTPLYSNLRTIMSQGGGRTGQRVDRWYVHYVHVRAYCSLSPNEFSTEGLSVMDLLAPPYKLPWACSPSSLIGSSLLY